MNDKEFAEMYAGCRVMIKPDPYYANVLHYATGIVVGHEELSARILIVLDKSLIGEARQDERCIHIEALELIVPRDNKPLPLPG
jgi:hypothetical protein